MLAYDIGEAIKNSNKIVITAHVDPDGDAIGSCLAMYNTILKKYEDKEIYVCLDDVSDTFRYLKNFDKILSLDELAEKTNLNFDLLIVLDLPSQDRLGRRESLIEKSDTVILIDHHERNNMFGDYNLVDSTEPSTTQIVYSLITALDLEVDRDVMTAILTGIITDTGGFRFQSVNEYTFYIAQEAKKMNIDFSDIFNKTLFNKTMTQFELEKLAIERVKFYENGKIAVTYLTNEDEIYLNRKPGETEGIVNLAKNVENVEISVFLREVEDGFKVSLRSNNISVDDIAENFDGGGHKYAAGCTIQNNDIQDTIKIITEEISKKLNQNEK